MPTISYSELQVFSHCRKQYDYAYNLGLRPKIVSEPLSVGLAGHTALEAYYRGENWRKALTDWRDKALTRNITDAPVLPQNEQDDTNFFDVGGQDFYALTATVEQIIERYILKWGETDKHWEVLEVEKRFEIPIPKTDYVLVGVWDLIVKDELDRVWLVDHKFPGRAFREHESLELDAQVGIYQWAATRYGYDALGFIYNQVLARLPELPKINKTKNKFGGFISIADCYSEWETYRDFTIANGEEHLLSDYEAEMVPKLSTKAFFDRKYLYRSPIEIDNFYFDLAARIEDLDRSKEFIYREPSKYGCNFCSYRQLCVEELKGNNIEDLIEIGFEIEFEEDGVIDLVPFSDSANYRIHPKGVKQEVIQ